jgi:transcriptional regulator with XRE-family HTH domain
MARELGVEQSTVHRWETDRAFPGMERLEQLAGLFGCTRAYLVLGEGDSPWPEAPEPAAESA